MVLGLVNVKDFFVFREGRWLKLTSGTVMIGLGMLLVMRPTMLAR